MRKGRSSFVVMSWSCLLLFACAIHWLALRVRPEDQIEYTQLITESADLRSKHAFEEESAIQYRSGVQKDIWTLDGEQRRHTRLVSERSKLTITQNKGKFSAEETLQPLSCYREGEKIVDAEKGIYYFPTHRFSIQHVETPHIRGTEAAYDGKILRFQRGVVLEHTIGNIFAEAAEIEGAASQKSGKRVTLLGNVRIESTEKKGTVQSTKAICLFPPLAPLDLFHVEKIEWIGDVVLRATPQIEAKGGYALYQNNQWTLYPQLPLLHCSFSHEHFTLRAETIQVSTDKLPEWNQIATTGDSEVDFPSGGRLHCQGPIIWDRQASYITAAPTAPLHFTDKTLDLEAAKASFDPATQEILLEGNIRLISSKFQGKETFALAEKAHYSSSESLLILTGSPERKALFWQNGFALSATELHLRTDMQTVEGKGPVHFAFDVEEQNYYEQIFSGSF